ncbi:MAG: AMP-binding protein [Bacteroidota bacterium]|nr:AMP-binding protein [Bacteroidota bacterium]
MSQPQETPLSAFYFWEKKTPQQTFLRQPISDVWKAWSYQQAGEEIRRIASALLALNLPPQSNIAILSKNCAHWIMADLAIMMAGHVSVPIYPTLSATGIRELLQHGEVKLIFVGKLDAWDSQQGGIDAQMHKISFPFYGTDIGLKWDDLLNLHQPLTENNLPDPDQLASIMYSSGTTGTPKGAMLSFGAFGYVGEQVKKYFRLEVPQRFFSYLPLSHIAERALMEMVALSSGSVISFADSIERFQDNLRHESPTIFGGVPRIFVKFQEGILKKIPQERLNRLLSLPGVNILVRRMIIRKLGLSKAPIIVCGAAPTPVALLNWFNKLGINIRETYGMTENTAYSHSNFRLIKNGTVGQAWPGADVRVDESGEILIRHQALMKGYFKDEATTAAVFTDEGFLRTGDQGSIDAQGFLTITGRIKDQFKTDKAKFIAPAPIELQFATNPLIDHVCVVGTGLPQPIALITLSESGRQTTQQDVESRLRDSLKHINATLEKYEQLSTTVVLPDAWSIENGLLTPSMKVKRNAVEKKYEKFYLDWTSRDENIVWVT